MSLHCERSETDVSPLDKVIGCAAAAETAKETTSSLHPLAASEINCESERSKRSRRSTEDVACERTDELCCALAI